MRLPKLLTIIISVAAIFAASFTVVNAQNNTNTIPDPPPSNTGNILDAGVRYFSTWNTNYESTFRDHKGSVWTGVGSVQGGQTPLVNEVGISRDIYKIFGAEAVTRDSGVAGTIVSQQAGVNANFVVHDAKLMVYLDGGYNFQATRDPGASKFFGEFGLRFLKALTENTYAGVGFGNQVPDNVRILGAYAGFVF